MLLSTEQKNAVLLAMSRLLQDRKAAILTANRLDVQAAAEHPDRALFDRLHVDSAKIDGMSFALESVAAQPDPVGLILDQRTLSNGLRVVNRSVPFGTILIIYESRPDVTIEATSIAFKAGSRILLKGGREAQRTNQVLFETWQAALASQGLSGDWVSLLILDRQQTEEFLARPTERVDLIVPRGGAGLIALVKKHATCPVLVSGRGNNFLFVERNADWEMTRSLIRNGKLQKVSACNSLDKVLFDEALPCLAEKVVELCRELRTEGVSIWVDASLAKRLTGIPDSSMEPVWMPLDTSDRWDEEFLDYKLLMALVDDSSAAIRKINCHSGGHSATIVTDDHDVARSFMEAVDCAAVYHNASTRFTDGGQLGLGAELAISTEKLHHRGPIGLEQLVSNKYYVYGNGQVRR
ncbi:MAG: glutamate-5-semialdehyde dehydrogenase [Planctomycetaceae bacterium]|nr:glutamate-5-semialdehyde dehydrogenase [Planctomycetaceae bacterium]